VSSLNPLSQLLEAALFAANRPLTLDELEGLEPESSAAEVRTALDDFDGHSIEIVELAGGYQILTRATFAAAVERAQAMQRQPRLSAATLETLATIAYRQPVGRAEIEEIRGVNAGGVLRTLQERGLIEVVGRSESLGRPLLYGTTPLFLELLGLNDLADLPRAEELTIALQPHRAEPSPDEAGALASVEEG
jgi:segregation and condensation protein B